MYTAGLLKVPPSDKRAKAAKWARGACSVCASPDGPTTAHPFLQLLDLRVRIVLTHYLGVLGST
jgi:hypothetical protein